MFCDPDRYGYSSSVEIEFVQKNGISEAIGMQPKSRLIHQDQWTDFCRALSTPGVEVLGEFGLDFTLPKHSTQENRLENLLGHITGPLQVVVVHCRGERKNYAQVDVNLKCLNVFKQARNCVIFQNHRGSICIVLAVLLKLWTNGDRNFQTHSLDSQIWWRVSVKFSWRDYGWFRMTKCHWKRTGHTSSQESMR